MQIRPMQIVAVQIWTALADYGSIPAKGSGYRALGSVLRNIPRLAVRDSWNMLVKNP